MSSQDTTVTDTLPVVAALRRHLKEDNCKHSIKSILREGLKSKAVAPTGQQQQQTGVDNLGDQPRNDYRDK
jgi:hypothetical protein